jgi:hypothetical protein
VSARAIHPLCYEHHFLMTPPDVVIVSRELVTYACPCPGCSICYQVSRGYFIGAKEIANQLEVSAPPRISCPVDSHLMYLSETQREHLSYRLWRCPICGASSVGGDLPVSFD